VAAAGGPGYNATMRFAWLSVICAGVLAGGLGFRAGLPGLESVLPTRPPLDPTRALSVVMTEDWSLWRTQEIMGDRQRRDKRSVHTQLFRQRPGADHAELVYETFQEQIAQQRGVLSDGTVVMLDAERRDLLLIDRLGQLRRVRLDLTGRDAPYIAVQGAFDEGLFVQPGPQKKRHGNKTPMFFVPFRGGQLDEEAAVIVTEGDGIVFRHRPVVRAWPQAAWIDEHGLFIFDLITGDVSEVEFKGKPERRYDEVRGFDGRFVALRKLVIDTQTGKVVAKFHNNRPITIRDGVMYELDVRKQTNTMTLQARDLTDQPEKTIDLVRVPTYDLYRKYGSRRAPNSNVGPSIVQPTDDGLLIHDGESWITVPYLDRDADTPPAEPTRN